MAGRDSAGRKSHAPYKREDLQKTGAARADGRIDKAELEFLADLRKSATSVVRVFTELFNRAVKSHMLEDGAIGDSEAKWLRKTILADKQADADEVQLLKDLKREAKHCGPEFQKLHDECVKS